MSKPPSSFAKEDDSSNTEHHVPITETHRFKIGQPDNTVLCEPCSFDDEMMKASAFCVECIEYICKSCHRDHKKNKMTRSHNVLVEGEIPSSKETFEMLRNLGRCKSHPDKEVEYKCIDHNEYICTVCECKSHRKCNSVEEIKSLTHDDCNIADSLMKTIDENIQHVNDHNQQKVDNIISLESELVAVKDELNTIVQEITDLLLNLKDQSSKLAESLVKEQVVVCNTTIGKGKRLIQDYEGERHLLNMALKYGSPNQVHIAVQTMSASLSLPEQPIGSYKECDYVHLRFHSNLIEISSVELGVSEICKAKSTVEIPSSLVNESVLGSDAIEEQEADIPIPKVDCGTEHLDDTANVGTVETMTSDTKLINPLIHSSLKYVGTHDIQQSTNKYASNFYGIVCVKDKIILIDRFNVLLLMLDHDFVTKTHTSLESEPFGICAINERTIVITLESRKVQRFQVKEQEFTLLNEFDVKLNCRGIAKAGSHVAIMMSDEDFDEEVTDEDVIEVQIRRTQNGHKVKVVDEFEGKSGDDINLNDPVYLLYTEDDHTLLGEYNKISDFDPHNRLQRVYRTHKDHYISGIRGLTTDDEGNIYACGRDSNNVHQISYKDFHIKRVIIPSIPKPWAIAFDPKRKRLIVSCENSNSLYEYQFTN